jgi:site-specific recombinase XerD
MARSLPNPSPDLASLLESWQLAMRGERKSPNTIAMYSDGVKAFLRWCESTGTPAELTKTNVQAFLADLIDAGAEGATAYARHKGLRRFAVWLTDEGELAENPLLGSKAPKVDRKVVEALTDEQLQALLKTCKGNTIAHRRDEAILRLCMETGARAGEVIGMTVADIDLQHGLVTIRRGKGGKGRVVPISAQAAAAMDRYVRIRRTHKLADTGPLWVGGRGGTFGYHALNVSMKKRADAAGITGFHLHKLRHTAATRWLRKGGSEQGLMAVAGWSTRSMLDRYTGASAAERAASEARTLDLGEL